MEIKLPARPLRLLRRRTIESFDYQWRYLPTGAALLGDERFTSQVPDILCDEELCVSRDWLRGKEVLDAGCGNGRWTYGFGELGCGVTALDASEAACGAVRARFPEVEVVRADILDLPDELVKRRFDVVFAWGVLHHTGDTRRVLKTLAGLVRREGLMYVYLYGKDSIPWRRRLKLEGARLAMVPLSPATKRKILAFRYKGNALHGAFDLLSTPINARLSEGQVTRWFGEAGLDRVCRTIDHTELFMKAWRAGAEVERFFTTPKAPPYWFQRLRS